jgi:hypothetical protein
VEGQHPYAAMWRLLFEAPSQPEKCEPRTMEAPMSGSGVEWLPHKARTNTDRTANA